MNKYKQYTLTKAILKAICYFDIFNIPLPFEKIKIFLYRYKLKNNKILKNKLASLINKKILSKFDKYYFLTSRDRIVKLRYLRKNFCLSRWKRAQKAAKWLQLVPFIRFIGVTNSLSINNSNNNSDIDFFIITKKNRLWTARLLTAILLDILGLNKNKNNISNRICLGFFIDKSSMDLSSLTKSADDAYHTYWLANINPIYDQNTFNFFMKKNIKFLHNIPNYNISKARKILGDYKIKNNKLLLNFAIFFEFLFDNKVGHWIENKLYKIQKERIFKLEKDKISFTIVNNHIMKLNAYNKNHKYNTILKNNYQRILNERFDQN